MLLFFNMIILIRLILSLNNFKYSILLILIYLKYA
jgi:hypothetical protein